MRPRPLYQISNEYQSVLWHLQEKDELMDEEIIALLDSLDHDFKDKAENIASFIKNLEHEAQGINEARSAMEIREKRLTNKIERLKDYLKVNMERCNIGAIETPYFGIKIKKNPCSVNVLDESKIPDHYFKEQTIRRLDRIALLRDLKLDHEIEGATLAKVNRIEIK